jgi:hypothetical protein
VAARLVGFLFTIRFIFARFLPKSVLFSIRYISHFACAMILWVFNHLYVHLHIAFNYLELVAAISEKRRSIASIFALFRNMNRLLRSHMHLKYASEHKNVLISVFPREQRPSSGRPFSSTSHFMLPEAFSKSEGTINIRMTESAWRHPVSVHSYSDFPMRNGI